MRFSLLEKAVPEEKETDAGNTCLQKRRRQNMKYIRIREKKTKKTKGMLTGSLLLLSVFAGCGPETGNEAGQEQQENTQAISLEEIPEYSGEPYVELENNEPDFTEEQLEDTMSYESYSELDELDRCGTAEANIGQDLMPTQERESISQVKPSGWLNKKYDRSAAPLPAPTKCIMTVSFFLGLFFYKNQGIVSGCFRDFLGTAIDFFSGHAAVFDHDSLLSAP